MNELPHAPPQDAGVAAWIVRLAALHRGRWRDERQLAHAINGTVVAASVIAAVSGHATLGVTVVSVLFTLIVYWIAENYAHLLASKIRGPGGRLGPAGVWAALRVGWPLVEASYLPLIVLLVVGLLTSVRTGAIAALCTSTVVLVALGYLAARRGGHAVGPALGWAAGSGSLGLLAIGLKFLLH